jgi:hypothetical protein
VEVLVHESGHGAQEALAAGGVVAVCEGFWGYFGLHIKDAMGEHGKTVFGAERLGKKMVAEEALETYIRWNGQTRLLLFTYSVKSSWMRY